MELMFPITCKHCGVTDEPKFEYAGPHIKMSCSQSECGRYQKFISKAAIPDAGEVRLKIWSISKDVPFIDAAKESCGFVDGLTGIDKNLVYWRLYLKVREMDIKWNEGVNL
jgi:hypothetical protein